MKRTQGKDALRNIRKQRVSYLSIILIAVIGVTIFLGLDFSARSLRTNASKVYNELRYHDIEVISTLLLAEQDLDVFRGVEGVASVEGVIQMEAKAGAGEEKTDVVLVSATEGVNLPQVLEGSLPAAENECAVEKDLAEASGWKLGDEIRIAAGESEAFSAAQGSFGPSLKGEEYVITAIIQHPDRANTNVPQDPYILLPRTAFAYDETEGAYLKAEILIDRPEDLYRFSEEYEARVQEVLNRLEEGSEAAAGQRTEAVRSQMQGKLDENQALLDDAKAELARSRKELDDGWKAVEEGEKELADGQSELAASKVQLDSAAAELAKGKKELEESRTELNAAKKKLDQAASALKKGEKELKSGQTELEESWDTLEDTKETIRNEIRLTMNDFLGGSDSVDWAGKEEVDVDDPSATAMTFRITEDYSVDLGGSPADLIAFVNDSDVVTDEMLRLAYVKQNGSEEGFDAETQRALLRAAASLAVENYGESYTTFQESCEAWDAGHDTYCDGLSEYNSQRKAYNKGEKQYQEGEALYRKAKKTYEEGLAQYEEGLGLYEQGLKDLEEGKKTLEENRGKLEEGEASYGEGVSSYEEGARQLAQAQESLDGLAPCRFLQSNARDNASFYQVIAGSQDLLDLKSTFALMFVLIGALVIFTTVGKMVDEQRVLVGTTKALGFYRREIFAKYLIFGVSATLIGILLGILAARFYVVGFSLRAYSRYYRFDFGESHMFFGPALAVLALGVVLSVTAIYLACYRLLKDPAIELMKEKVPGGGKKENQKAKSVKSLYSRLIFRNMKRDLKRVVVTVVSVAGCCALVVVGVTLKTAVNGASRQQYQRIVAYDEAVSFDPSSERAGEEIGAFLEEAGAEYTGVFQTNILYRVTNHQAAELMVGDVEAIHELYHLLDWKSGAPLTEKKSALEEGILIQRRIAEIYDLSEGDELEISIGAGSPAVVKVAGIFEHYIGNPMVMSASCYEKIFGEPARINRYLLRLPGSGEDTAQASLDALNERLRTVSGFAGIISSQEARGLFDSATGVVNALVWFFIFMAIAMAGVVLLNLTNMYLLQKKNELTVMRINGFSVKETIHYVIRETVITTFLGIVLGIAAGSGIAYRIVRVIEQPFFQLYRRVSFLSWGVGIVMTVGLTVLVNLVALRPVRNLKLTDIE